MISQLAPCMAACASGGHASGVKQKIANAERPDDLGALVTNNSRRPVYLQIASFDRTEIPLAEGRNVI